MIKETLLFKYKTKKADDAIRTRDIGLGRTTLYLLSYIRKRKYLFV